MGGGGGGQVVVLPTRNRSHSQPQTVTKVETPALYFYALALISLFSTENLQQN